MDIRNCKRCGKLFSSTGSPVCNNCTRQDQEDFDKVRDFLFDHPNSTILEIAKATEVDGKTISRFLKEGRLKSDLILFTEEDALTCEKCGTPISSGRFCQKCVETMKAEFSQSQASGNAVNVVKPVNNNNPWQQSKVHTYEHIVKKK